jgi:hypothetical protein
MFYGLAQICQTKTRRQLDFEPSKAVKNCRFIDCHDQWISLHPLFLAVLYQVKKLNNEEDQRAKLHRVLSRELLQQKKIY